MSKSTKLTQCKLTLEEFKHCLQLFVFQEHFYLETQVTIAVPKGEAGEMELFVSTQNQSKTQVGVQATNSTKSVLAIRARAVAAEA